jgi:uncharacterized membrane protein HdeD (DUF308 family)
LLGVVCAVVGVVLTLRPFTSLEALVWFVAGAFLATGVSEIAGARNAQNRSLAALVGLGWIAAGLAVVVWPGHTIHALAIVAGISMVLGGLARVAGAVRGSVEDRMIAALTGAASLIFGVLALSWPDITVLILGLLVGPSTVIFGLGQLLAVARAQTGRHPVIRRHRGPPWLRLSGSIAAVALALGLVAVSAAIHRSTASPDAFYKPLGTIPARPGMLLRVQRVTRGIPRHWRAWRILYTTTRDENEPAVASGLVIAAGGLWPERRPVIAWAHGTTGVASQCAPSLLPSLERTRHTRREPGTRARLGDRGHRLRRAGNTRPAPVSHRPGRSPIRARFRASREADFGAVARTLNRRLGTLAGRARGAVGGHARPDLRSRR